MSATALIHEARSHPDAHDEVIDLWQIARELSLTPKGQDRSSRNAIRIARRARFWFWVAFVAGLALAATGILGLVVGLHEQEFPYFHLGFLAFAIGTPIGLFGALSLLSANAFRQLGSFGRRLIVPSWWVFTVSSYVFALTTVGGFFALWIAPESVVSLSGATLLSALVSVMCSMLASSSAQPLVSTATTPRLYQVLGSQFCWTVSLLALLLGGLQLVGVIVRTVAPVVNDAIAIPILISVGLAFGTSIIAWHRRSVLALENRRLQVIDALLNALRALRVHDAGADLQDALLRWETLVRPSPFRAQSPAARSRRSRARPTPT
ncbi:MAG: hypothetical protein ACTH8F_09315 [Microbacterium sp.]|uniref:hypothetical protein n=1 Tax=Microbacterium sp. TaxID=51671 RepID=UPI003F998265